MGGGATMEKKISVGMAQYELNIINKNLDELQEALLGLIEKPCYVAEVLMGAMIKEAKQAGRTLAMAGYVNEDDLLADYMDSQQKEEKA
jgi:hypothetical protein